MTGAPGNLAAVIDQQESEWQTLVARHVGPAARLLACSASSPHRRVYERADRIFKIVRLHEVAYQNTLKDEWNLLQHVRGLPCVPEAISFVEHADCSVLELSRHLGLHVGQIGDDVTSKLSIRALFSAFLSLNRLRVRHGDAHIDNILILPNGALKLLDFDQAVLCSPVSAFLGDFLGIGSAPALRTVLRLVAQLLFARLPRWVRSRLPLRARVARRRARRMLPQVLSPEDGIAQIWRRAAVSSATAPGLPVAYYRLAVGDRVLPGERAWEPRWAAIRAAVDFRGKRLLEIGCNLGLLSCYAQRAGALPGSVAIDRDPDILLAARELAVHFGTAVDFRQYDLDTSPDWDIEIPAESFQIASALSVMHWLKRPQRLLAFLARIPEILYEGHDHLAIEVGRLRYSGFRNVLVVGITERNRVLLYATK